jgi:hypothetical protein
LSMTGTTAAPLSSPASCRIAKRVQEEAFGTLDRATLQLLDDRRNCHAYRDGEFGAG